REPGQAVARGRRAAEAPPGDRPEGGAALGVVALRLAARRWEAPGDRAEADARVVLGLGRLAHHAVAHHAGLTPGPRRSVLRQRTRTEVKVHDEAHARSSRRAGGGSVPGPDRGRRGGRALLLVPA